MCIKEQKDRTIPQEIEIEGGGTVWWFVCPECHGAVDQKDSFCKSCGQALKCFFLRYTYT